MTRAGTRSDVTALAVAGLILVLMSWAHLILLPVVWLGVVLVGAVAAHRWLRPQLARWGLLAAVALLGVAPLLQVVVSHIQNGEPYPTVELAARTDVDETGEIEDVLLLIVDGYPSPAVAETWFGHDTSALRAELAGLGFDTPSLAWSHHTFTRLAIPSILELQPITEPGPKDAWGNTKSTYQIIRGHSFLAHAFRSAGFSYTHIESGWNGGVCGTTDQCLPNELIDEAVWKMLRPTALGDWMAGAVRSHTVSNTLRSVEHLRSLRLEKDGQRNFVFAHLLLPHAPFVVDSSCEPTTTTADDYSGLEEFTSEIPDPTTVAAQLSCVDGLISEIVNGLGPEVAVLITGDHGSGVLGQGATASYVWSDADIAERLGVFLTYRVPDQCPEPDQRTNIGAMQAIATCALDLNPPVFDPIFLLGTNNPQPVSPDRLSRIEAQLTDDLLNPGLTAEASS